MNGIIIVDKPQNYTSFDVIAVLRKKFNQKKLGHMGTLDPMATGVLPILLGDTAKFQIFTQDNDKEYIAKMEFGLTTDTLDSTGKILSKTECHIKIKKFNEVLKNFVGEIEQVPPMFSAIKKNGKKLCDLARKGIEIEREKRKINIISIKILDFNEEKQTATIKVKCSCGTYIRSLCNDIGNSLGCGAVMIELRRTESNGFNEKNSLTIEKLKKLEVNELIKDYILLTEHLFKNLRTVNISEAQEKRFRNGGALSIDRIYSDFSLNEKEHIKLYSKNQFVGLGCVSLEKKEIKVLKCLN